MIKLSKNKNQHLKNIIHENQIYDSKYSSYPHYNIKNFNSLSLVSKYPILYSFYTELNKSNNINPRKGRTKDKKATLYDITSEPYNEYLEIYFNQYMTLLRC